MDGVTKTFPGVVALDRATLRVRGSEVHALIGENGAGKSTMIKVLTGAYRREGGTVHFDGVPVEFHSPQAAQAAGISTIYQEINLIPYLTVAENIFLGREPMRFGLIDWGRMNRLAVNVLRRFDIAIDVTRELMTYNIAVQQMVAIARAVSIQSRLVVMDEPTSSLDEREVTTLFGVIRQLKSEGVSVIFVSHRLDELYAVCDRVTIMRDGRTVLERAMRDVTKLELVSHMLGRELGEVRAQGQTGFSEVRQVASDSAEIRLQAAALKRGRALRGVDVTVRVGEIVGLAGLLGSGRTETARAIFGADVLEAGELRVSGKLTHYRSPRDAIRDGIGLCPEDRKTEGIIPHLSVRENLTLALLPRLSRHGVVDKIKQAELVERFITRLSVRTSDPDQPIRELSGGNQQKVLLARWLCINPRLLILDEPTRGIDVGAKAEIQKLIEELAREGLSVLMISSELEELTEGCDSVVVLRDGHSVARLERLQINEGAIITAMAHGAEQPYDGIEPEHVDG